MSSAAGGAIITILARPAGWIINTLRHRWRFRVTAPLGGVVTAREPEPLEISLRGREEELAGLEAALEAKKLIVIGGWAGIGKTTLGRALAERLAPTQTCIWVDCKPGMGLESLINALANYFGVSYEGFAFILKENLVKNPELGVAAFVRTLDHQRNVLFLDDFHLVEDRIIVNDLLRALRLRPRQGRTVVLTREVDRIKEGLAPEGVQETYAHALTLLDLDRASAVQLLRDRGLRETTEDELGRLHEKTGGHPKGLELCAGLLRSGMPMEGIEKLPLFQHSGDEQRSLRRILQETERRLSRDELRLLARCSVFDEPFSAQAMECVYQTETSRRVAATLEEKFLLSRTDDHHELHPLLREYFHARLKDDSALVHGLAGHHYLSETDEAPDDPLGLTLTLKAHRHFELAGDHRQLLELFWRVFNPLELSVRLGEAERICELTLDASGPLRDRGRQSDTLGALGIICARQGEMQKAIEYYEQALDIAREIGDRRGEGNHLGNLGNAYADLGQLEKAIEYHKQALVISKEIGDRRGEGSDLGNLGLAYAALGQVEKAIEYYQQALEIAREIGDRRGEGSHLNNLGEVWKEQGEYECALASYLLALEVGQAINDPRVDSREANIEALKEELGDDQFAELLERVQPNKESIVQQMLESGSAHRAALRTETS
ncbi:MAG: hypothetical protein CEE40_01035 [Chloroflexi bacterium B3_Chlor]|nr:MAG: hypothetical protein CEE40_01035 [Chloroflexi bacterium B3_Chlor]